MAKLHVGKLVKYSGYIRMAGMTFDFETLAVSEGEASNNGIAQFARRQNVSIARMRQQMREYSAKTQVKLLEP